MDDDRAPHFIQSDDDDDESTSTDGKQLDHTCTLHVHMHTCIMVKKISAITK